MGVKPSPSVCAANYHDARKRHKKHPMGTAGVRIVSTIVLHQVVGVAKAQHAQAFRVRLLCSAFYVGHPQQPTHVSAMLGIL